MAVMRRRRVVPAASALAVLVLRGFVMRGGRCAQAAGCNGAGNRWRLGRKELRHAIEDDAAARQRGRGGHCHSVFQLFELRAG